MKSFRAYTPSRRFMTVSDFQEITRVKPERGLTRRKSCSGGRNHNGHATNQNIGGGHKRRYRIIDFRRDKRDIPGKVVSIEYDPNRTSRIALIQYPDGEKRYVIAPGALRIGDQIMSGEKADIKPGNALPLKLMPVGQEIFNIELKPGRGGQLVRSAGNFAQLLAKEGAEAMLRLPSGEIRKVNIECYATVGAVGNSDHQNLQIGKAGRSRWLGRRPHTRGTAKNPVDHPLGGGQGKTKGGRHPVSRTGVLAKGFKTRNNKRTDKFIVRRKKDSVSTQ